MPVRSRAGLGRKPPVCRVERARKSLSQRAFRLSGAGETESRDFKGGFRKTTGRKCDKERQENRTDCEGPHSNI